MTPAESLAYTVAKKTLMESGSAGNGAIGFIFIRPMLQIKCYSLYNVARGCQYLICVIRTRELN